MFASLNVVRIAAVDCDCTSRSATRCRSRDIGTRCSGRAPKVVGSLTAGAWSGAGAGARAAGIGAAAAGAALAGLPSSRFAPTAASTSPLVMRPPRPVPATSPALRFCSAISLRAAGNAPAAACVAAVTAGAGAAAGAVARAAAATSPGAAPFASVSMTAMTSCAVTVAPSGLRISATMPESGAGNSSTTLSVSTSTRFSSRVTASPAFLCQLTSVASVIDSGRTGTLTSMSISLPRLRRSVRRHHLADVVGAPEVDEVVIDLAAAHDNAAHVLGDELVGFGDHRLELAFGELLQRRHGGLVPQQAFRAHDDQRLTKVAHHLPAQQM